MKVQPTSFRVTKWNVSKTMQQEFNDGVKFKTAIEMDCQPFMNFDKYRNENKALVTMEWICRLVNFIEYTSQTQFHVDYSDYNDEEDALNSLIIISIAQSAMEFDKRKPGISANDFFPEQENWNFQDLKKGISKRLHDKK